MYQDAKSALASVIVVPPSAEDGCEPNYTNLCPPITHLGNLPPILNTNHIELLNFLINLYEQVLKPSYHPPTSHGVCPPASHGACNNYSHESVSLDLNSTHGNHWSSES